MKTLVNEAKQILNDNWRDGFSVPSSNLYPFQWLWDSGFIAIGLAQYDFEKATQEIETLLKSQWKNGFMPHIIFHDDNASKAYFPNSAFYQSQLSPHATEIPSSTITQPPVLGFVLKKVYDLASDKTQAKAFLKRTFSAVLLSHSYLYNFRDPFQEGLVYIQHNWESGIDNSPIWDEIWKMFNVPEYEFVRRDTQHVDAAQRPSKKEYNYYLYLVDKYKLLRNDDKLIAEHCEFLVQDPLFNSMLVASNEGLIEVAKIIGEEDKIAQLKSWNEKTINAMNSKLWNEELNCYVYYDLHYKRHINMATIAGMSPLMAGIPTKEQAGKMIAKLQGPSFGNNNKNFLCSSFDCTDERFEPLRYWRGPVWINTNWIVWNGLKRYGFQEMADTIKADSIALLEKYGFHEYFDPRKSSLENPDSKGLGSNNFSWSAALYLDMISQEPGLG
jgi:hypothetical protein